MTTRFTLLVTSPPTDTLTVQQAIAFAQITANSGHIVDNIFFYMDGVNNANASALPMTDEFNAYSAWSSLSESLNIPLLVCVTAAEKRGVVNPDLKDVFKSVGLSDFFERLHEVDKLVQF